MLSKRKKTKRLAGIAGFTLIELLVVISIIALLMSIMLPALGAARENAKKMICSTNLRSIGTASNLFVQDNDGWLPVGDGKSFVGSPYEGIYPHRQAWYKDIALYLELANDPWIKESKASFVAKDIGYDAPDIFVCPSAKTSEFGFKVIGYGWNWVGAGYRYRSSFNSNWWKPSRLSKIKTACESAIIGECPLDKENETRVGWWGGEVPNSYGQKYYYGSRHKEGSSYVCADGHIEYAKYEELKEDFEERGVINYPRPMKSR